MKDNNKKSNPLEFQKSKISKGSYTQLSFLALKDNKLASKPQGSKLHSTQGSYASLSQLQLNNLASESNWNELDNYELEELRDGFFDAIYTKSEFKRSSTLVEDTQNQKLHNIWKPKCLIDWKNNLPSHLDTLTDNIIENWVYLVRFFLAYLVAMILSVIHPTGTWIGHKYRYFMPISTLLHHPARNIGVQLEMTVASCGGTAFALGWSGLAWYISTATGPTESHQGGILFQSLVLALWFSIWLRVFYQRFFYFCQSFGITIIFTHTVDLVYSASSLKWILYRDFALSYIFGLLISLLVCAVLFPKNGNAQMIKSFDDTVNSIKNFLIILVDTEKYNDNDSIDILQKKMIKQLNIDLSETYRGFLNQFTILYYKKDNLRVLRDSLTVMLSPLRVIPVSQRIFDHQLLEELYKEVHEHRLKTSNYNTGATTVESLSGFSSGAFSPIFGLHKSPGPFNLGTTNEFYIGILKKAFSKDILALILQMIVVLDKISKILIFYQNRKHSKDKLAKLKQELEDSQNKLNRKIYNVDAGYNKFLEGNFFSDEILKDFDCIDIFLFIRYMRSSAKHLIKVIEATTSFDFNSGWTVSIPKFNNYGTLHRLPNQCLADQCLGTVAHYNESKKDVDEIFERSYNSYTSRHAYSKTNRKFSTTRALDHTDFSYHTTENTTRFRIWKFSTLLVGKEMKWTLKCLFCIIFLCLPSWLAQSNIWYQKYQCWWGPMIFFILSHNTPSGKMITFINRLACGIIGMFWGWAAAQAYHFGNPYVIAVFSGIIAVPFAVNFLIYQNSEASYTALISFTVIALEAYSKDSHYLDTATIWKNCWVTSISLIIGIIVSIAINWIFWSIKSRTELRLATSALLAHLSQSYQSVTERYLYHDLDDAPTEMSLAFSHIREVRMTRNIEAVREVLDSATKEPTYVSNFDPIKYKRLIDTCQFLFEKMIEARIAGAYFQIWDQDLNEEVTRALLSLRRDSTSSVIYVFYLLSNCLRSKNKIPKYLPNTVVSRKRLFDFMSKFEHNGVTTGSSNDVEFKVESLERQLFKKLGNSNQLNGTRDSHLDREGRPSSSDASDGAARWKSIYGIAFARSFTDVCEAMERLIYYCKDILGEESH